MSLKSYYYENYSVEVKRLPLKDEIYGATRYFGNNLQSHAFPWQEVREDLTAVHPASNELFIASLFTCVSIDMMLHHNLCQVDNREQQQRGWEMFQKWDEAARYPKFGMTGFGVGSGLSRNPLFILKCAESEQVISAEKMLPVMPEIPKLIQSELQEALDRFFPGTYAASQMLNNWYHDDPTFMDPNTDCEATHAFRTQLNEYLQNNA